MRPSYDRSLSLLDLPDVLLDDLEDLERLEVEAGLKGERFELSGEELTLP